MKIKSLTLHGFKSFADRTKIDLHDGITAVVGPNGCGKSNISDALRWVLGEQRPTAIRGSRMDEAIFGGTEGREPIHRAEVSLQLSNEDGALPLPYSEVEVSRTVYRGGESEYAINGGACRLKDIHDLCRDTGLGANAYAIMEGRMIDAVLSDRADERRALFEEAAAIGRYKDRRRTAIRQLEKADGDLQRLDDLLAEVRAKVRSLAQQRGRAVRHGKLRTRLLRLEVAVVEEALARGRERLETAGAELATLRDASPAAEARLQTAETEAETLRLGHAEQERARAEAARELEEARQRLENLERERLVAAERVGAARERIHAVSEELEWIESRRSELAESVAKSREGLEEEQGALRDLAEREAELATEVERLESAWQTELTGEETARRELESLSSQIGSLEAEFRATGELTSNRTDEMERKRASIDDLLQTEEELRAALERLQSEEESVLDAERGAAAAVEEAAARLERCQATARALRAEVARLEGEVSAAGARVASLEDSLSSIASLPPMVGELLESGTPGVMGVLSDFVEPPGELAAAVESHLGPYLHGVVVQDWESVSAVRAWLVKKGGETGGMLLLPLDPGPRSESPAAESRDGSLADRVGTNGAGAPWVRALLSVVTLEAPDALGRKPSWVRPDGTGVDQWGAVRLGPPARGKGVLRRRAELEDEGARAGELEAALEEARTELAGADAELAKTAAEADESERRLLDASGAARQRTAEAADTAERLASHERERAEQTRRLAELESSIENVEDRAEAGASRLEELRTQRTSKQESRVVIADRVRESRKSWEARRTELHEVQVMIAGHEASVVAATERLGRAEETVAGLDARAGRLQAELGAQQEIIETGEVTATTGEAELERLFETRRRAEGRLREVEASLEESRADLERREAALREDRRADRELSEHRHALELETTELRAAQSGLRERLEAEWDAPLDELRSRVEELEEGSLEEGSLEEWEAELEQVRRSLARIGPVNLLADTEYEEEQERLAFLTEQRDDLVSAGDDLRTSIRRVNRTAAEAFSTTFDQIRENFQRTFETLFEGGECDVWLEDPAAPLDSPIEISASPRGKRTQRIHLLSGGERALTALALLFAIYQVKPSPFCLMDEVDAPLDETNIRRFVNMLQRFKSDTQFVVITHNPRTIEKADWIYGVTMQEPGVSSVVGVELGVRGTPSQVA